MLYPLLAVQLKDLSSNIVDDILCHLREADGREGKQYESRVCRAGEAACMLGKSLVNMAILVEVAMLASKQSRTSQGQSPETTCTTCRPADNQEA